MAGSVATFLGLAWVRYDRRWIETVIGGGDDYELLFTAPRSYENALTSLGSDIDVPVTCIGSIDGTAGVRVIAPDDREILPTKTGYRHF